MRERMRLAILIPLLVVIVIITYSGGLGVAFMLLDSTPAGELGVIGLGMTLVIGVPTIAALLQRRVERQ